MSLSGRTVRLALACAGLVLSAGCTTTSLVLGVAGVATDTSVTWTIVKYVHAELTEGDPRPCVQLTSVQRALSPRCGAFEPGSIVAKDIDHTGFAECSLTLAVRDPNLWPVVPELLAKGARPASCSQSPLVALAQSASCPDFEGASPAARSALAQLAVTDPRAVHHDVMRMLSCPAAHRAGLDAVLTQWRERGVLKPGSIDFSPLGALHPDALDSALARALEADGHTARAALGGYNGRLAQGFEEALRTSQWTALDWWFARLPELANRVPPRQGDQLSWLPLARVLVPTFLQYPESRREMVAFLIAHGANPRERLPSNPSQTIAAYARTLKSPLTDLLEPPAATSPLQRVATVRAETVERGE